MKETERNTVPANPLALIHDSHATAIMALPIPVEPFTILKKLNPLFGKLTSEGKEFLLRLQGFIEKGSS
ncbi:hypothetical protein GVN16_07760 [Emticicia sp. CRIBPO]|uniref:hypothetical protein n=1 Tax=Emticicia sp. CRIBPO TaxID=2683258 RepID=UPI00141274AA|nr:hypothetical protein [Emticicia sp. CRIBPO]NBA85648.1 hypothetical protein [Emticicia sp. CRIBPO]